MNQSENRRTTNDGMKHSRNMFDAQMGNIFYGINESNSPYMYSGDTVEGVNIPDPAQKFFSDIGDVCVGGFGSFIGVYRYDKAIRALVEWLNDNRL